MEKGKFFGIRFLDRGSEWTAYSLDEVKKLRDHMVSKDHKVEIFDMYDLSVVDETEEGVEESDDVQSFDSALKKFVDHIQGLQTVFADGKQDKIEIDPRGRRYIRIVKNMFNGQRCVHCFVERDTGNVFKSAGWKSPAKHVRGTIFTNDVKKYGVTEHGANYLV